MMKALILGFALAVAGCGTLSTATMTPKQRVIELQGLYRTALTPIATYVELPRCSATQSLPCSESTAVAQLQKAVKVAELAVDAADSAVYTPGFGADAVTTAIAAADAAVKALKPITPATGAK
jgi:hypothetical protein